MLLRQFVDDDLGCASYLIADEQTRQAVVVDPAYAIEPYLQQAQRDGLALTAVLETHTHADHVSGHGRLALEHGLPVHVHPEGRPEYPFEPLMEGRDVVVGGETIRVLHTPGHRPEHCCFVAGDMVLTGDSLFVGSAARPDLAVEAREGAEGLFHSLQRLAELPERFRVYPGHVAGSLCGTGMSGDPSSTIGAERLTNPALSFTLVDDFVDDAAAVSAPRPPNMSRIVDLNRGPFLGAPPPLEEAATDVATILDVRPARAFAAGHVAGALNVPVAGSSFGTRVGFLLTSQERVVIHADTREDAELAARRLRAVGFIEIAGYVLEPPQATETLEPVTLGELEQLLARGAEIIDVREHEERSEGYIAGTRHIPYRLLRACTDGVPRDRPVVTLCESGVRAGIAASVLAAAGIDARPVLEGGIADLQSRGRTLVEFRRCGSP